MKQKRILIVNDDVSEAIKLRTTLRSNNFEVTGLVIETCDAIQQAGAQKPDLVILKIGISGSADTIEAASKIIENYRIPVLFILADWVPEIISQIKKQNDPEFLIKPYPEGKLVNSIEIALKKHTASEKSRIIRDSANIDPVDTELSRIPAPAITVNKRGAITRSNRDMEYLTGYSRKELIGKKFLGLIGTSDAEAKQSLDDETQIWPGKVTITRSDKTTQRVSILTGYLKTYGNNFDEQILVFKKESGEVEFATKDIDLIFAKVLNSLDEIVFVLDKNMEITHYNQKFFAFAKRLSITSFHLTRPVYEIPQFSKIANVNIYEELFRTGKEVKQIRRYGSEKERIFMMFRFIPLETGGEVSHMITVMQDITEIEESRQKSSLIYDEFMKNKTLIRNIHSAMGNIRTTLYQIVKFVEKNPEKLKDPSFQQVAKMTRKAEKNLIVFDSVWKKYETQLNMIQMNAKYKFDKK